MDAMDRNSCPADLLAEASERAERDTALGLLRVADLLETYPSDARLHFLKGSLLAALSRFGDALGAFSEAVRLAPSFALARFQMGMLELTSGDVAGASRTWSALQDLPHGHSLRLFAEGLQHLARDDFARAEAMLREGMARNREVPVLNQDMQLVLDQMAASTDRGGAEPSSSAQLLLQLAGKGTRH